LGWAGVLSGQELRPLEFGPLQECVQELKTLEKNLRTWTPPFLIKLDKRLNQKLSEISYIEQNLANLKGMPSDEATHLLGNAEEACSEFKLQVVTHITYFLAFAVSVAIFLIFLFLFRLSRPVSTQAMDR
jgi:hypothetical protein